MTSQVVKSGIAVMLTLLALVVLWQFRIVVGYALVSLTLAAVLRPLVQRLRKRSFVIRIAWLALYIVSLGSFGSLIFLTGEAAIRDIQQLANTVSAHDRWILPIWLENSALQQSLVAQLPVPSKLLDAVTGDKGQLVLPILLGFTQGIGGVVSSVLIILFLSIYWSINQNHFERLWLSLLPSERRKQAREIWQTVEQNLGSYIRGEVAQSILTGLVLGLGYWLLGSPYPALLALVGALTSLIPVVGTVMAVMAVLLVGLLTSLQVSLLTVLYTLVALTSLGTWVMPRIFKRRWDNPILTIILLIALAEAFGLIGIIFAPPLSAIFQILWKQLVSHRAVSGTVVQIADIKGRQARVWETIESMDEPPPPLLTSSMESLNNLIEKAEPLLQAGLPTETTASLDSLQALSPDAGPPTTTKP
jgi:predicted PurR-regulated permease PerM